LIGAGALLAVPLPALAQQPAAAIPRIGFLGASTPEAWASRVEAFRAGLRDLGYVEGRNVVIEFRFAEGQYDRLPELELMTAEHLYQRPGRYTIAVKVIDIFGNDTMTLVPVNVG
jgi:putative ABC transport system substrate-binding protein